MFINTQNEPNSKSPIKHMQSTFNVNQPVSITREIFIVYVRRQNKTENSVCKNKADKRTCLHKFCI